WSPLFGSRPIRGSFGWSLSGPQENAADCQEPQIGSTAASALRSRLPGRISSTKCTLSPMSRNQPTITPFSWSYGVSRAALEITIAATRSLLPLGPQPPGGSKSTGQHLGSPPALLAAECFRQRALVLHWR